MKEALLVALGVFSVFFVGIWAFAVRSVRSDRTELQFSMPSIFEFFLGFVTNFFDTLGIGSFATTSSVFKLKKVVPDELIPGTLNVGHTMPTIVEAFIFIAIVQVDVVTMISMIASSVIGAWLGAGVVSKLPKRTIQLSLGLALFAAAALMFMTQLKLFPGGGTALGLHSIPLLIGVVGNCLLGALMTLGIGLYAPCMILISMLGMDPHAAFPIMMGSCAFLMPVGSARFVRSGRYSLRTALGLAIGGIPGVLIAAFLVKSLPLDAVRWLVICVVVYASLTLLRSAVSEGKAKAAVS
jgi:uncharacterized membrane protein YfcA